MEEPTAIISPPPALGTEGGGQKQIEYWYAWALERLQRKVRMFIEDALEAANQIDNPIALAAMTEVLGHSAKIQARAVKLHPEYFDLSLGDEDLPHVQTILSLFTLATLPNTKEAIVFAMWQSMNLPLWRVKEEVDYINHRAPRKSHQVLVADNADVSFEAENTMLKRIVVDTNGEGSKPIKADGLENTRYEVRIYKISKGDKT